MAREEDTISRQAVLDIINANCVYENEYNLTAKHIKDAVESLPPTTLKQKIGHWIKYGAPRCGEQHYKCISCGYYINFGQWGDLYTKEFKYCPNCGAKMEIKE